MPLISQFTLYYPNLQTCQRPQDGPGTEAICARYSGESSQLPSALVGGQLLLKDGRSLLQKVNLGLQGGNGVFKFLS